MCITPQCDFSPLDFKSGCLWMLSPKLSTVQSSKQHLTSVPEQNKILLFLYCSQKLSSNLLAGQEGWTDRYICPLPSLLAVVTSAILRGYIGSLTYFYQHFPIPPLGQKQHPFEGQGRKICSLPVCCPLHVSSRGHYSMGSVIHTHRHKNTNHFIDTYNYRYI